MTSLIHQLKNWYFTDTGSSTKAGMIDYLFANRLEYLLIDEIDKTSPKDQAFLLILKETGIVNETKYGKRRREKKLSCPLGSRFFIVEIVLYTYEQFCEITTLHFHVTTWS